MTYDDFKKKQQARHMRQQRGALAAARAATHTSAEDAALPFCVFQRFCAAL
jgi:hypothetical protein